MKKYLFFLILLLFIFFSVFALAREPELIKDINTEINNDKTPFNYSTYVEMNGIVFYRAISPEGEELWRTDGTEEGTYLVKDIAEGASSGYPSSFYVVGSTLYFTAYHPAYGYELWKSDGTEEGTVIVKDIYLNDYNGSPSGLNYCASNDVLLFMADHPDYGKELWRTDGTEEGTMLVKDITTGTSGTTERYQNYSYNGELYISYFINGEGYQLWKSDGTEEGTKLIKVIFTGYTYSHLFNFFECNNTLYFTTKNIDNGTELWKTDGTEAGTIIVKDIYPGTGSSSPSNLIEYNNLLYFRAYHPDYGYELWRSDGTEEGTQMVKDIYPGTTGSNHYYPRVFNGLLYILANHPDYGYELWKSNGTEAGTQLLKDIYPGTIGAYHYIINPEWSLSDKLYITAQHPDYGSETWVSDGTEAGTQLLKDFNPGTGSSYISILAEDDTHIYFNGYHPDYGYELWKSDGTEAGTIFIKDIDPGPGNSNPYPQLPIFDINSSGFYFYFVGRSQGNIPSIWRSDGTEEGTIETVDLATATEDTDISELYLVGDEILFSVGDDDFKADLWKTDGTEEGTVLLKDFDDNFNSKINEYSVFNNELYFSINAEDEGYELWKSDGTEEGTILLKDIYPGWQHAYPSYFTEYKGKLFFTAVDPDKGKELWMTDGSEEGTKIVKDIDPEGYDSEPILLTISNNILFFAASCDAISCNKGEELWMTDGTEEGTVIVKDIYPGARDSKPRNLTNVNGTLFFTAYTRDEGTELWISDGTEDGTILVKDITPGWGNTEFLFIDQNADILYFIVNLCSEGRSELWRSDGTEEGTFFLKNIAECYRFGIDQSKFLIHNETLFCNVKDQNYGFEVFMTDGTEEGTALLKDIYPGTFSSVPITFFEFNGYLYFTANHPDHGWETWKSDGTEAGTILFKDFTPGPRSGGCRPLCENKGVLYLMSSGQRNNGRGLWKTNGESEHTYFIAELAGGIITTNVLIHDDYLIFGQDHDFYGEELWRLDTRLAVTLEDKTVCSGNSVQLAVPESVDGGSGVYTIQWHPAEGLDDPSKIDAIVLNPTKSKTYMVTVTDQVTGEVVEESLFLDVKPAPLALIEGPNPHACVGNVDTYTTGLDEDVKSEWMVIGGNMLTEPLNDELKVQWTSPGSATITLVQTNVVSGCSNNNIVELSINNPPITDIMGELEVCSNTLEPYHAMINGAMAYNWEVIGGSIIGPHDQPQLMVHWHNVTPASIRLTATYPNSGCSTMILKDVQIDTCPIELMLSDKSVCKFESVSIADEFSIQGGSGDFSIQWLPVDGLTDPGIINPTAETATADMIYRLYLTDNITGEYLEHSVNLTVHELPVITGLAAREMFRGEPIEIAPNMVVNGTPPYSYRWSTESGEVISEGSQGNMIVEPTVTTTYYLVVTDGKECESSEKRVTVVVKDGKKGEIEVLISGINLNIFPNPVESKLNIQLESIEPNNVEIRIIDILGIERYTFSESFTNNIKQSIDTQGLPSGTYFIEIRIGSDIIYRNFIKK